MMNTETWHGPEREMSVPGKAEATVQALALATLALVVALKDGTGKLLTAFKGKQVGAKERSYNPYP